MVKLTQILGTDSLSSSRIVINDNFSIIANTLENYQEYFDENGVYSSVIISKNAEGTIDFKTDENHSRMVVSPTGVEINGELTVHNNATFEDAIFDNIDVKQINLNSSDNNDKIKIVGDVEITGDLTVTGEAPGGGGSSSIINKISIEEFNTRGVELGYIETYNIGCYVEASSRADIKYDVIRTFINSNPVKILQYVNKPFIVIGKGCQLSLQENPLPDNVLTNGMLSPDRNYVYCPGFRSYGEAVSKITEVKIYPLVLNNIVYLNIEFSSVIRQN